MRNRHIAVPITFALMGALTLAGCTSQPAGDSTQRPTGAPTAAGLADDIPTEEITTTVNEDLAAQLPADFGDTLTVAIDLSSPPARFIDGAGDPVGFNVDFTNLLTQKLGLEAKIENVPLAQIVPGLAAKRYDIAINNLSRNPEREAQLDMVEYMQGSGGIAIPADNPNDVTEKTESLCALHIGVLSGSYQESTTIPAINEECEAAGLDPVTFTAYGTNNEAILALGSGRVEAWIGNGTVAAYAAERNPEVFQSLTLENTWSHDNLALPKGSELTEVVAEAFQELMDEGTYMQVLEKWGIPDYALEATSLTQTPVTQK